MERVHCTLRAIQATIDSPAAVKRIDELSLIDLVHHSSEQLGSTCPDLTGTRPRCPTEPASGKS
jgi:hypothetical protein